MINKIKEEALINKVPIIKDDSLKYLLDLIKDNNFKDVLELGTAVGYSSIMMACLSEDIKIDTLEKNDEMYLKAIENIKLMNLEDRINVYHLAIEEFETDKLYDFIFVDAAKAQYQKYLEKFLPNLKEEGMMFFDNMSFHGMTSNVEEIKNRNTRSLVKKINKFKEAVRNDARFDIMIDESIGDGFLILKRRNSWNLKI